MRVYDYTGYNISNYSKSGPWDVCENQGTSFSLMELVNVVAKLTRLI